MGVFRKEERGGLLGFVFFCLISSSMFFKRLRQFACCGLLLCATLAGAAEFTITAESRSINGVSGFVNTTVHSGLCALQPRNTNCSYGGSFNTFIDVISENGFVKLEADRSSRMGPYFSVNKTPQKLTLTNEATGSAWELEFALRGFGGRYILSQPVPGQNLEMEHAKLWRDPGMTGNSGWGRGAPTPSCLPLIGPGAVTSTEYNFVWSTARFGTTCYKQIQDDIPGPFRYRNFEFIYSLGGLDKYRDMDAGVYKGSMTFSVGPGGDVDFGDKMIPSDNVITINFELTVKTILKVDFPPGSNRAILQPLRGWQAWLNSGRTPPALSASHGFKISGYGLFRVYLSCDIQMGLSCGIQGHGVATKGILVAPVDIAVTFPPGITRAYRGGPAIKVPLKSGVENAEYFQIWGVQKSQSATIHYDVAAENTALMVKSPGSTYQGAATIIFDVVL